MRAVIVLAMVACFAMGACGGSQKKVDVPRVLACLKNEAVEVVKGCLKQAETLKCLKAHAFEPLKKCLTQSPAPVPDAGADAVRTE